MVGKRTTMRYTLRTAVESICDIFRVRFLGRDKGTIQGARWPADTGHKCD